MSLGDIAISDRMQKFYDDVVHQNWTGTKWESHARVPNKAKGSAGELIIKEYLLQNGNTVKARLNEGHDLICNDHKLEVKFSMAKSIKSKNSSLICPNNWMFNHIEMGKDWTHIVFVGINPPNNWTKAKASGNWEEEIILSASKKDLLEIYKTEKWYEIFRRGQGGDKSNNDDWLIDSEKRFNKLMELPFVIKNPIKI
jgi:hypothetical protein|tara:strand:- start:320 stop:913 length:594 start_codon:yes stop_codon:yes gene_type:complete